MRKILFAILFFSLLGNLSLNAQDQNRVDDKGRKQGKWVGYYANGTIRYEGSFKNDKCQGTFTYYDSNGTLKATNTFDKSGSKALNKTYAPNGTIIATEKGRRMAILHGRRQTQHRRGIQKRPCTRPIENLL